VLKNESHQDLKEKFGSMNFALLIWIIRMAAILSVDSNLADFAFRYREKSTGALEQGPNQRRMKIFNNIT
jgi:hypothetical protein